MSASTRSIRPTVEPLEQRDLPASNSPFDPPAQNDPADTRTQTGDVTGSELGQSAFVVDALNRQQNQDQIRFNNQFVDPDRDGRPGTTAEALDPSNRTRTEWVVGRALPPLSPAEVDEFFGIPQPERRFAAIGMSGSRVRMTLLSSGTGEEDGVSAGSFAQALPSQVQGNVFVEVDQVRRGLGKVPVALSGRDDLGNPVSLLTHTNENGNYRFAGLRPGSYTVTIPNQAGYVVTPAGIGSLGGLGRGSSVANILLFSNDRGVNYNFRAEGSSGLAGTVRARAAETAERDAQGVENLTVVLTGTDERGQQIGRTTRTHSDGSYRFEKLPPGVYRLQIQAPDNYRDWKGTVGDGSGIVAGSPTVPAITDIVLTGNAHTGYDFTATTAAPGRGR